MQESEKWKPPRHTIFPVYKTLNVGSIFTIFSCFSAFSPTPTIQRSHSSRTLSMLTVFFWPLSIPYPAFLPPVEYNYNLTNSCLSGVVLLRSFLICPVYASQNPWNISFSPSPKCFSVLIISISLCIPQSHDYPSNYLFSLISLDSFQRLWAFWKRLTMKDIKSITNKVSLILTTVEKKKKQYKRWETETLTSEGVLSASPCITIKLSQALMEWSRP